MKLIFFNKVYWPKIKEAQNQSEKRLLDSLKNKDDLNKILANLLNMYVLILVALISSNIFITNKTLLFFILSESFFLCLGVLFFLFAFKNFRIWLLGSNPEFWLEKNTIKSKIGSVHLIGSNFHSF